MNSNTPNKGLGCLQAMGGEMTDTYKHRRNQCLEFSSRVIESRLCVCEAHSLTSTHIIPTVTYSMSVTLFAPKQYKDLNIALGNTMVNKYKVNKRTKRATLYSPLHMDSMNYPCFKLIQTRKSILNLMKQLWLTQTATPVQMWTKRKTI